MKKFFIYLKDFHKGYFSSKIYVCFSVFVAILIAINYKIDLENSYIDSFYGKPIRSLLYFALHAVAYYGVIAIIFLFSQKKPLLSGSFWLKSSLGLLILAIDRSIFPMISDFVLNETPQQAYKFWYKILFNTYGFITILFMLIILKLIFDRKEDFGIYGLRFNKVDFKPYLLMLLGMVPIIYIASLLPDFISYYPLYKRTGGASFAAYYNIPEIFSKIFYETIYVFDFINTEVLFRGFLIIGLAKFLGKDAILPMAATYAALHFGKPMAETISSIFGGYLLGIIALYSRNIWGGVFIHGGIAFLMEIFAFAHQ